MKNLLIFLFLVLNAKADFTVTNYRYGSTYLLFFGGASATLMSGQTSVYPTSSPVVDVIWDIGDGKTYGSTHTVRDGDVMTITDTAVTISNADDPNSVSLQWEVFLAGLATGGIIGVCTLILVALRGAVEVST